MPFGPGKEVGCNNTPLARGSLIRAFSEVASVHDDPAYATDRKYTVAHIEQAIRRRLAPFAKGKQNAGIEKVNI
jgi:hypothetical protein